MTGRVGLAISGGGFRATAFGLGSLRALNDRGLLPNLEVVSGISGGSLLAAMWAYGPESFDEFDASVVALLESGLQAELLRRAVAPRSVAQSMMSVVATLGRRERRHSRTDALVSALAARPFGAKLMSDATHNVDAVISATDMQTGNAVRFGSKFSASSKHGRIVNEVTVAEAVASSAAFPILLPALTRRFTFERPDGTRYAKSISMTDGGVYDNLGLSPLMPGRTSAFNAHVYDLDVVIAIDAGRGRGVTAGAAKFAPKRLAQSFDITHTKSQDAARSRLHQLGTGGELAGFLHVYLGMRDERLPLPLADLVPRERVQTYPTDFARMKQGDIEALSIRGEQLTRSLIQHYLPDLTGEPSVPPPQRVQVHSSGGNLGPDICS